jgi:DNA modification methylase
VRIEKIGDAALYHADCMDVLPTLDKVNAVVTDPPYGIKRDKGFEGFGGFGTPIARVRHEDDDWDQERPPKRVFDAILDVTDDAFIFGGNFFADLLPQGTHWVVWDKKNTMPTFGDAELAWTNLSRKSVKIIEWEYNGLIGKERYRQHPTQKPVGLMDRVVSEYGGNIILDPFMGSGTTGVACANLGRKFIGIEKEEKYFDIACERIDAAYAQGRLFA